MTSGADVAFLFSADVGPTEGLAVTLEDLASRRRRGSTVVGLNLSSLMIGISPYDETPAALRQVERAIASAATAVTRFLKVDNRFVLFIPHASATAVLIAQLPGLPLTWGRGQHQAL